MKAAKAEAFRSTVQRDNNVAFVSCGQHTVDGRRETTAAAPGG